MSQEPSSMSHTDREPSSTDRTDQEATPTDNETRPASGIDRSQFLLNQLPFFMRLLADITQSTQTTHGSEAGDATDVAPSGENPSSSAQAGGSENGEAPSLIAEGSTAPNDGANANFSARPRRHHATIRFIQVGGGPGRRSGVQTPSQEGGEDEAERDSNATPLGDDVNEAVIMFLTGPNNDAASDTEDSNGEGSGQDGSNGTDTTGGRRRHRAPWVVMTLSGAYLSSLMAAGVGGEGGANYDDLWMLSNLIGPARPITTTQEAIDNAGFAVGRFEQEFQGMRNATTLGDSTRCLVCMSEYEEGEDMRALNCKHGFHVECIDKWLTTGANKCPVCRSAAVTVEPPMADPEVSLHQTASEE
ncbi:hypothetical protein BGZ99_007865 [Dissophora globulifera]|uniref:RING-type E3 ubiquitin transferase n=1 Tax=Dissophora globulifera TaxID=979702 RepID=A0A9P6UQC7_9FUNG|nr:hypothetical protein BGZ99_007865 [Dissophora globulifera]